MIKDVEPKEDYTLHITTEDGRKGFFDVMPYFKYEAFRALESFPSFKQIFNGGYFVEWECGADLSADTIEAALG